MISKAILAQRCFGTAAAGNRVGFIGLGNMGLPMANNLKKNGFQVKGYDIGDKQKQNAIECGISVEASLADTVRDVDWIVTALPKTEHVEEALNGKDGIFEIASKGTYILDTSTISPVASADFHA